MSRLSIGLVLLVGILAGGLGLSLYDRSAPAPLDATQVRAIVADMLQDRAPAPTEVAALDPAMVNPLIEDFLMADPAILQRMADKLTATSRVAERQTQSELLKTHHAAIYEDAGNVIVGNPDGDVTLVEMFDYNCGYCRKALPDLALLLAEDPNLKVILKEFPILSAGSVEAAKVAVLIGKDPKLDYWAFHEKLFSSRGQIAADTALKAAEEIGGSRVAMMLDMNGTLPADTIQRTYDLATALSISGTPTFIIGDELIPGAVGIDTLRLKIANMRACGSTVCAGGAG